MKLKNQLSVLEEYIDVAIIDKHGLSLLCKAHEVPKDIRERTVKSLHRASSDYSYDFLIELKV